MGWQAPELVLRVLVVNYGLSVMSIWAILELPTCLQVGQHVP